MGPVKYETVGKSQSLLIMINPITPHAPSQPSSLVRPTITSAIVIMARSLLAAGPQEATGLGGWWRASLWLPAHTSGAPNRRASLGAGDGGSLPSRPVALGGSIESKPPTIPMYRVPSTHAGTPLRVVTAAPHSEITAAAQRCGEGVGERATQSCQVCGVGRARSHYFAGEKRLMASSGKSSS
jgi:ribosomal protein L37E